ncbi:MAG: hypothetical protein AB8B73_04355 [Ekhidna sp.]
MANEQELIDQYHSGNMSPEKMIDFEKQIEGNPELKAESNFQSDIINGLKEVRKAELKSRLNAIDLSPGWAEFAMQSSLIKSFGGVAVATLIGSGVYMLAEKQEIDTVHEIVVEVTEPQPLSIFEFSLPVPNVPSPDTDDVSKNVVRESVEEPIVALNTTKTLSEEIIEKESGTAVPTFSAPDANLIEDENAFESSSLDELPNVTSAVDEEIEVTMENTKSVDVRYKYYDGKLFLKGDFDRAPYEILEINSATGRRIFIQYLNKYYQVETTDKLKTLPEVTDQKLINELKILKETK